MKLRRLETWIAKFTLGFLVIYIPVETWTSLPYGLLNPFYIVDVIAMVLMAWGAYLSLKSRPNCSPEILCVAYAWGTANAWRATFWRLDHVKKGGDLDRGMMSILIYLVMRKIR